MNRGLGMSEGEISQVLARWNKGVLESYLVEITRDILAFHDKDGVPMVTKIMDSAGQKVRPPTPRELTGRAQENGLRSTRLILASQ
jgi:6-phosphogluconate dehydrogenase